MMALHDEWLSQQQKDEIDRLWRLTWKTGRKPESHWKMLRKLKAAGCDIRRVECDWHIPPIDKKLPDWQIALSRRSSDPDVWEQIAHDRLANIQLANQTSGNASRQLGARNAAESKKRKNIAIIEAYKQFNSVPAGVYPMAVEVADWWIKTQSLPISEKHKIARRLEGTGLVR